MINVETYQNVMSELGKYKSNIEDAITQIETSAATAADNTEDDVVDDGQTKLAEAIKIIRTQEGVIDQVIMKMQEEVDAAIEEAKKARERMNNI